MERPLTFDEALVEEALSNESEMRVLLCTFKWRVIMSLRHAAYVHFGCGHEYGFSPVCVRR